MADFFTTIVTYPNTLFDTIATNLRIFLANPKSYFTTLLSTFWTLFLNFYITIIIHLHNLPRILATVLTSYRELIRGTNLEFLLFDPTSRQITSGLLIALPFIIAFHKGFEQDIREAWNSIAGLLSQSETGDADGDDDRNSPSTSDPEDGLRRTLKIEEVEFDDGDMEEDNNNNNNSDNSDSHHEMDICVDELDEAHWGNPATRYSSRAREPLFRRSDNAHPSSSPRPLAAARFGVMPTPTIGARCPAFTPANTATNFLGTNATASGALGGVRSAMNLTPDGNRKPRSVPEQWGFK